MLDLLDAVDVVDLLVFPLVAVDFTLPVAVVVFSLIDSSVVVPPFVTAPVVDAMPLAPVLVGFVESVITVGVEMVLPAFVDIGFALSVVPAVGMMVSLLTLVDAKALAKDGGMESEPTVLGSLAAAVARAEASASAAVVCDGLWSFRLLMKTETIRIKGKILQFQGRWAGRPRCQRWIGLRRRKRAGLWLEQRSFWTAS